jgi:two-component system sensor histidine kinase KdpD
VTSLLDGEPSLQEASGQDLLTTINESADHLNAIIGNLLDLSRITSGVWQPGKELNDLPEVLGTVLERFDEESNQRIVIELPADLPPIPMDYVHIAQVLWNLLDNALKYSPATAPVRVEAHSDGSFVTVGVSDQGPGVPVSERERIFEKFYRARQHSESSLPGTGMGLAICRGIVEAHGGRIWVREDRGPGATFYFTLPLELKDYHGTHSNHSDR